MSLLFLYSSLLATIILYYLLSYRYCYFIRYCYSLPFIIACHYVCFNYGNEKNVVRAATKLHYSVHVGYLVFCLCVCVCVCASHRGRCPAMCDPGRAPSSLFNKSDNVSETW